MTNSMGRIDEGRSDICSVAESIMYILDDTWLTIIQQKEETRKGQDIIKIYMTIGKKLFNFRGELISRGLTYFAATNDTNLSAQDNITERKQFFPTLHSECRITFDTIQRTLSDTALTVILTNNNLRHHEFQKHISK
ncbi:hypothetical protein NPIL_542201 [Nephila pilipes]|uniref:Uncharacterized protein n=1 Tax=Nephila pilipes TaxID=299642 RepID=A0A8X6U8P4_NEPPI|nr:hypothetical protein NPIL_542201 [Nephila pilipes]